MINVTKTFLPPISEYNTQLERVWKNEWLTNRGELVLELESKLKQRFDLTNLLIMTNGTIPIQIAMKLLGNRGEIITTPFSYVATTSSIIWESCTPVFVDIDPDYLTIDESKIEAAITDNTTCILATHVFGNPCAVEEIEAIAIKYNLKVIYDAAHCFDVNYKGKSVFHYGDVSTCSFHATKLFHTAEGGSVVVNNDALFHKFYYSHNFGHNGPLEFYGLGINGKISEVQAAMGLAVYPHIENIKSSRKSAVEFYNSNLNFANITKLKIREFTDWNYSYYPIIFDLEETLLRVQKALNDQKINPRRYFYPSLNKIDFVCGSEMPISENIASRILCLPLYKDIEVEDLNRIVKIVNTNL